MEKEKGVSLIIAFFIMVIILAVVLSISSLLYSQIKVIRNIGNSVVAFYAADSGVEKLLFYDRQIFPNMPEDKAAVRGLCSMCDFNPIDNPEACTPEACTEDPCLSSGERSVYCNRCEWISLDDVGKGCDYDVCNNCKISFSTIFSDDKYYVVEAMVTPSVDGELSELEIKSYGVFNNVARRIEINSKKAGVQDVIRIENACASPKSAPQGETINISADISATRINNVISSVQAVIYDSEGNKVDDTGLYCESGPCSEDLPDYSSGYWKGSWDTSRTGAYYVDIEVVDSAGNKRIKNNIPSCDI